MIGGWVVFVFCGVGLVEWVVSRVRVGRLNEMSVG